MAKGAMKINLTRMRSVWALVIWKVSSQRKTLQWWAFGLTHCKITNLRSSLFRLNATRKQHVRSNPKLASMASRSCLSPISAHCRRQHHFAIPNLVCYLLSRSLTGLTRHFQSRASTTTMRRLPVVRCSCLVIAALIAHLASVTASRHWTIVTTIALDLNVEQKQTTQTHCTQITTTLFLPKIN